MQERFPARWYQHVRLKNRMSASTPLYDIHVALGAKMTEFGGWIMPECYGKIWDEYRAVRGAVGLFDTSHMRAFLIEGADANAYLQFLTPRNVGTVSGKIQYALLTNPSGGTVDDCTIFCESKERYYVIVNAGNIRKDFAWMGMWAPRFGVSLQKETSFMGMLALQGPRAQKVLARCADGTAISAMKKYTFRMMQAGGHSVIISRTGYTGEDGFEILCDQAALPSLWNVLLAEGGREGILPCGLGARDLLRLEAWMPLYGHELDEKHGPIEAKLEWTTDIRKPQPFIGNNAITDHLLLGTKETLIGLRTDGRGAILRCGAKIAHVNGYSVGSVTSGAPYPSGMSLAMAYVKTNAQLSEGRRVKVLIRNTWHDAIVVPRTFTAQPVIAT